MTYTDLLSRAKLHCSDDICRQVANFRAKGPVEQSFLISKLVESLEGSPEMERVLGTLFLALPPEAPYGEFGGDLGPFQPLKEKRLLWIEYSSDGRTYLVGPTENIFNEFARIEGELALAAGTAALDATKKFLIPGVISSMLKL